MPVRVKFSTKGFDEFLEQVRQMGKDVDQVTKEALQAGGDVLLDGMLRRVPRDTGNLADNLAVDGPFQDGNYVYVSVGVSTKADGETVRYATAQEYGWGPDHPAQPFVRPAMDEDMAKARAALREVFKREIGGS